MQGASLRVTENVKQAREQALVGAYDDSKVFYGGAIQGIQQLLKEKDDQSMKDKWKQVRHAMMRLVSYCWYSVSVVAGTGHAH